MTTITIYLRNGERRIYEGQDLRVVIRPCGAIKLIDGEDRHWDAWARGTWDNYEIDDDRYDSPRRPEA